MCEVDTVVEKGIKTTHHDGSRRELFEQLVGGDGGGETGVGSWLLIGLVGLVGLVGTVDGDAEILHHITLSTKHLS
jgi:hypothetical protein